MSEKKYLILTSVFILLSVIAGISYVYIQNSRLSPMQPIKNQEAGLADGGQLEKFCDDDTLYNWEGLDKALEKAESVCKLDISGRGLTELIAEVYRFPNLEVLIA